MRINELRKPKDVDDLKKSVSHVKQVDSRDQSWMHSLPKFLNKYGFTISGTGKYSSVFVNEKYPYALKIFMKDAAFIKWLKFCKQNQGNPLVPEIRGGLVKITDLIFAIRMEKLKPYSYHDKNNELNQLFMKVFVKFDEDEKIIKTNNKHIDDIFVLFQKNNNLMDLHHENMMADDAGQIKIIDPFYNWYNTSTMKHTIDPDKIDF